MSSASAESSEARLAKLHDIIRECRDCDLALSRTRAVPGEGSPYADLVLIGEAPGASEDAAGRPFCGPAGQLLDELLASIGIPRASVFITNTVKCRPPGNRVPTPEEAAACADYLKLQVALIRPKVVATLGGPALKAVTGVAQAVSEVHGRPIRRKHFALFPLYHPAAALHKPPLRDTLFDDMRRLAEFLGSVG